MEGEVRGTSEGLERNVRGSSYWLEGEVGGTSEWLEREVGDGSEASEGLLTEVLGMIARERTTSWAWGRTAGSASVEAWEGVVGTAGTAWTSGAAGAVGATWAARGSTWEGSQGEVWKGSRGEWRAWPEGWSRSVSAWGLAANAFPWEAPWEWWERGIPILAKLRSSTGLSKGRSSARLAELWPATSLAEWRSATGVFTLSKLGASACVPRTWTFAHLSKRGTSTGLLAVFGSTWPWWS